jgi:hypothetical protein
VSKYWSESLTALFLGFRPESLIIALTTFKGLPRIGCIALHADFLVEQPSFGLRKSCHAGAVEDVVIMICAKNAKRAKELINKLPMS